MPTALMSSSGWAPISPMIASPPGRGRGGGGPARLGGGGFVVAVEDRAVRGEVGGPGGGEDSAAGLGQAARGRRLLPPGLVIAARRLPLVPPRAEALDPAQHTVQL